MTTKEQYTRAHRLAKVIVCFIVISLLLLGRYYSSIYFDAGAVVIWFFGVNPVAYLIESLLHFKHKHPRL